MDLRLDDTHHGIRERVGSIVGSGGPVPLAIWTPDSAEPTALVLVGHGASGTKHESYVVALARALVRRHRCAVVAIDGPVHGDRGLAQGETMAFLTFAQRWSSDADLTDAMVSDWIATLDAVIAEGVVDATTPVGYWGLSMGTIFGLPFVAAEPRVRAAVLGLMGASGPSRDRLVADAARVTVPTLFLLQWDDQLIARADGLELFGLLAATDKTLLMTPGAHADITPENFQRSVHFLADRLSGGPHEAQ